MDVNGFDDPNVHPLYSATMVEPLDRRPILLVVVAAETGVRFARDGLSHDPAAWMLAPRAMFEGVRPLEACQSQQGFLRALLLHGLSMGLDADPAWLDLLLEEGDDEDGDGSEPELPVPADARCGSAGRRFGA